MIRAKRKGKFNLTDISCSRKYKIMKKKTVQAQYFRKTFVKQNTIPFFFPFLILQHRSPTEVDHYI